MFDSSPQATRRDFPPAGQPARAAFTLVELLVVIAIIGILVALLLPAIQAAREAARRAQCANNIKNVSLAVLTYESHNKMLPEGMTYDQAGDNPVNAPVRIGPNWIIKVLPGLEEQALYDSFERTMVAGKEVWTPINQPGANNKNVDARGTSLSVLLCASDGYTSTKYVGHGGNWARGNYAASAGRDFLHPSHMNGPKSKEWGNSVWTQGDTLFCKRGVMGPNAGVTLQQITDGTAKTIMLGELRAGPTERDARGVWALGLAGSSLLAMYGAGGDANGPNACYGSSDDVFTDIQDVGGGICTPPSNPIGTAECMNAQGGNASHQATVRSRHPGGAHIAMCDGSTQFISDDVETSGCWGSCCSVWDYMILSSDNAIPGLFNGASPRGNRCD